MKKKLHTTFAAIHLGSEKISMQIVEYRSAEKYKVIEYCERSVRIGEETFKNKLIPFHMVNEICEILQGFKILMQEYGVDEYKLQATTAVREAKNQLFLLDKIYCRTGLTAEVVDLPQEIYTKYVSIRNTLKNEKITSEREGMLMMDISSGGLGVTFVQDEQIKYQENFHVGIIRIKESYERNKRESMYFNRALTEFLSSTFGPVPRELQQEQVRYLVLSGTETELMLRILGLEPGRSVYRIKADYFLSFFTKMRRYNLAQLMKVYDIPENVAELVLPTVLLYEQLLNLIPAEEIVVTSDSFIDGMQLLHIGSRTSETLRRDWERELLSLFRCIGQHYHYDAKHAAQVELLALAIFDKIARDYGMGPRERLLLRGAALLHDVGKYINMRSHSRYSYDLIMSTDILGFSNRDKRVIALASYYHANKLFDTSNTRAPRVPAELAPLVAKLAAIVRLADALDRSYKQKIRRCVVSLHDKVLTVAVESQANLTLEDWTFAAKSDVFTAVYGLEARLERLTK